jgi:hypothetical protein
LRVRAEAPAPFTLAPFELAEERVRERNATAADQGDCAVRAAAEPPEKGDVVSRYTPSPTLLQELASSTSAPAAPGCIAPAHECWRVKLRMCSPCDNRPLAIFL